MSLAKNELRFYPVGIEEAASNPAERVYCAKQLLLPVSPRMPKYTYLLSLENFQCFLLVPSQPHLMDQRTK
jgi:hypothetical protein